MAKGIGLIGNFSGKVGNTVGYQLSASNNGQTQGVRVYQPNVKNPKTAAQAEQRAKLSPVNVTYRLLKDIIDRGNEGLPYGNKSRLAWLKIAMKAPYMPWYEKGATVRYPVGCQLTKGSLAGIDYMLSTEQFMITAEGITSSTSVNTIGAISTILKNANSSLKDGDQVTIVGIGSLADGMNCSVMSFLVDTTSSDSISGFTAEDDTLDFTFPQGQLAGAIIVSREGENGQHLRSTTSLFIPNDYRTQAPYDATSKTAAIKSYMKQAGAEGDWAEESLQD